MHAPFARTNRRLLEGCEITIRLSTLEDGDAIQRLAQLDSRQPPSGGLLLAIVDGEPWAALYVTQEDFYGYAVLEGEATVSPVAAAPDDATVDELVEYYRAVAGEHPDWDDYRRAMVADKRCVVRLTPTRAYGML